MIPLRYNVRNLKVRWVSTVMTVMGTGLVVWSACILFGLVDGLQHSLNVSGDPLDLIIVRKGSSSETNSGYPSSQAGDLATLSGIARDENGTLLVANEMINVPNVDRVDGTRTNVIVRGVSPASPKLRPHFTIESGRYFEPGRGEAIVSRAISHRFKGARIGGIFKLGERDSYRVVGVFTAGGSAAESEVWVDLQDMERNRSREGIVSSVQLRAASPEDRDRLKKTIDKDAQFRLSAIPESEFFATQSLSSVFLKVAGSLIAILLSIGAMFAAANTMFAAVSARTREIGTMRALGFSRRDLLVSFLFESVLLCSMGGVLGLLATLPMSAMTFGMSNFNSFAEMEVAFRIGPLVMIVAVAMTLGMGIFGGLFPAIRAVRLDVIRALREL
jgi:putative ABC transport system permease protein